MRQFLAAAGLLFVTTTSHGQAPDTTLSDSGPRTPLRAVTPCVVLRIVDGDTIRCHNRGLVRLIGIDSPEPTQQPFGAAAAAALATMLLVGDTVQLESDVDARDRKPPYPCLRLAPWRNAQLVDDATGMGGCADIPT